MGDFLMKKTLILIIIAFIVVILVNKKNDNIIIPTNSIRIRIIANNTEDKSVKDKIKVKKNVERKLYSLLKDVKNVNEAKKIIDNNMDELNIVVKETTDDYKINYGLNYFPKKVYKGIIYDEGYYDSLVITLGEGNGNNWWCVLFPPLCLLDDNDNTDDVKYKFFVKELIDKYFKGE